MKESINIPYVKQFEVKDGVSILTNPIDGKYQSNGENRRVRRMKPKRIMNNRKSFPMVVHKLRNGQEVKFKVSHQFEFDKDGKKKIITHYN